MAIKKISEFAASTTTDDSYILFEKDGSGKSAKFSDFSLSYEEIMATNPEPDLSGKVASGQSLRSMQDRLQGFQCAPYYTYQSLGASAEETDYFPKWIDKIYSNHPDMLDQPLIARVNPNGSGIVIGYAYKSSPRYCGFLYIRFQLVSLFGYNNGIWYYTQIT